MSNVRKPPVEYTIAELDRELIARGTEDFADRLFEFEDTERLPQRDRIMERVKAYYKSYNTSPRIDALRYIDTWELVKIMIYKSGKHTGRVKGIWGSDDRMDFYEIRDEQVKKNAASVALVCLKEDIVSVKTKNSSMLKTRNYGRALSLCELEPFRDQPILMSFSCTGFLVKDDVIATAAHFADEGNVGNLRIVFGYSLKDRNSVIPQIPNCKAYKGEKIIGRVYDPEGTGADWALVKLDRKVEGQEIAVLSEKEVCCCQDIYVMGHPNGLPLKYAPGAKVSRITPAYFAAGLDIYSGNSGSPVFDTETHEVIGMVVRGDEANFRKTKKGWISVIYGRNTKNCGGGAECTKVSEFSDIVSKL